MTEAASDPIEILEEGLRRHAVRSDRIPPAASCTGPSGWLQSADRGLASDG